MRQTISFQNFTIFVLFLLDLIGDDINVVIIVLQFI